MKKALFGIIQVELILCHGCNKPLYETRTLSPGKLHAICFFQALIWGRINLYKVITLECPSYVKI